MKFYNTGDPVYLDKLHKEILVIMDEIHRICLSEGFKYYMTDGTLLGAVRHKGFIPWDDDFDIVMPRRDFDKLIEIASEKLNPKFSLNWITTDKAYKHFFAKIVLNNTLFESGSYHNGIFVDIFPLDSNNNSTSFLIIKKQIVKKFLAVMWFRYSKCKTIKLCLYKLAGLILSNREIHKICKKIISTYHTHQTHYSNFVTRYSIKKQTMPIDWYGKGVLLPFEDRRYMAPCYYDNILNHVFGSQFMQIPPEEQRRCHYPSKVIFSDGTVMEFNSPEHKVSLQE